MKTNVYGALMILALAMIVSAAPLAQAQAQARAKANVPFDFNLDQKSMPAGIYEISSLGDKVLVVRNLETRNARLLIESMTVQAPEGAGTPNAKLVFRKCGGEYFLSEIWDGQNRTGIAFPKSKREKEMQLAGNTQQSEIVVIAMK